MDNITKNLYLKYHSARVELINPQGVGFYTSENYMIYSKTDKSAPPIIPILPNSEPGYIRAGLQHLGFETMSTELRNNNIRLLTSYGYTEEELRIHLKRIRLSCIFFLTAGQTNTFTPNYFLSYLQEVIDEHNVRIILQRSPIHDFQTLNHLEIKGIRINDIITIYDKNNSECFIASVVSEAGPTDNGSGRSVPMFELSNGLRINDTNLNSRFYIIKINRPVLNQYKLVGFKKSVELFKNERQKTLLYKKFNKSTDNVINGYISYIVNKENGKKIKVLNTNTGLTNYTKFHVDDIEPVMEEFIFSPKFKVTPKKGDNIKLINNKNYPTLVKNTSYTALEVFDYPRFTHKSLVKIIDEQGNKIVVPLSKFKSKYEIFNISNSSQEL